MTSERLKEISERAAKATPGPWRVGYPVFRCVIDHNGDGRTGFHGGKECRYTFNGWSDYANCISQDADFKPSDIGGNDSGLIAGMWDYEDGGIHHENDAPLIAHARTDIPELLAHIQALEEALDSVAIGGNHLANQLIHIGGVMPGQIGDYSEALAKLGQPYADIWVAWKRIMESRAALSPAPATTENV